MSNQNNKKAEEQTPSNPEQGQGLFFTHPNSAKVPGILFI